MRCRRERLYLLLYLYVLPRYDISGGRLRRTGWFIKKYIFVSRGEIMITVTEEAAVKLKEIISRENKGEAAVRIQLQGVG